MSISINGASFTKLLEMSMARSVNCLCKSAKTKPIIRLKGPLKKTSKINFKKFVVSLMKCFTHNEVLSLHIEISKWCYVY